MSSNNIFHNHLLNLIERKRLCADDTLQAMNAAGVNDDRGDRTWSISAAARLACAQDEEMRFRYLLKMLGINDDDIKA